MRFMIDSPIRDPVSAFDEVNVYRLGISLLNGIRAIKPVAQIKIFDGAARNPHARLLSGGRGQCQAAGPRQPQTGVEKAIRVAWPAP
jgi:hypothetical protein